MARTYQTLPTGKSSGHTQTSSCGMGDRQRYKQRNHFCHQFSRHLQTPAVYTVTVWGETPAVFRSPQWCAMTTSSHSYEAEGRQSGYSSKGFFFWEFPVRVYRQPKRQRRHQPLYDRAELTELARCPIQFTSVFCHHDTSELLCLQFVFRGSSRH